MCFGIVLDMLRASTEAVLQNVIKVKVMKEGMLRSPASKLSQPENQWPAGHLEDTESKLNAKSGEVGTISAKVEAKTEKQQVGRSSFVFLGTFSGSFSVVHWLRNCPWVKNYVFMVSSKLGYDITWHNQRLRANCLYSCFSILFPSQPRSPGGAAGGGQTHWFAGAVDGWRVEKGNFPEHQSVSAHIGLLFWGQEFSKSLNACEIFDYTFIQFFSTWSILITTNQPFNPTSPLISTIHPSIHPSIHPLRWPR